MRVAQLLNSEEFAHPKLKIHLGSTAPESATGPIRTQKPSHLVVIDAAALGTTPGSVALLERQDIDGITFCTHALPLSVVIDFIQSDNPELDAFAVAVQAEQMLFGEPLSARVEETAIALAKLLFLSVPE
jgi:hydrogenase 3 maturation protease